MRIVELTPGTGHFFCGSCLRDNILARALRARGHDAMVVPLYLPMVLEDDTPDPEPAVLMGGINLYLQHLSGMFQKLPRGLRRVLDAPGLLRISSRLGNMTDASRLGAITLDTLRGDDGPIVRGVEELAEWLSTHERPDVVMLSNVMLIGVARRLRETLDCPILCTLQGEAPFLDSLPEPYREQAWAILRERIRDVDHVVAVSGWYRDHMADRLGLSRDAVQVAWNGVDVADLVPSAEPPPHPTVGYLARLCDDKGLPTLVDAFVRVAAEVPDARLHVAGVMLREDRPLVRACREKLAAAGLSDRAVIRTDIDRAEKVRLLQSLSVLSVPATYGESFGLYLIEALACGVPVVQPRHAAFPELIEATGGGVLCEPDDPEDLARAITGLLRDPERRRSLGGRGRDAVLAEFTAARMAERVEAVLTRPTQFPTKLATPTEAPPTQAPPTEAPPTEAPR